MRLFVTVLAGALSLFILSSAEAASDVRITALDCGSHPRRVRIENLGDTAQDLAGWKLVSDSYEGEPLELGQVGSIDVAGKFFVFQGHLAPPTTPASGYYRWGAGEIFYLRANDSSDYVRIVDPQGNTIDQRNCEGLPPGATPAPPSEFDPPPITTPVVTVAPTPTPAPATTSAPTATGPAVPAQGGPAVGGSSSSSTANPNADLPAFGGPPLAEQRTQGELALVAGILALIGGLFFLSLGFREHGRRQP